MRKDDYNRSIDGFVGENRNLGVDIRIPIVGVRKSLKLRVKFGCVEF